MPMQPAITIGKASNQPAWTNCNDLIAESTALVVAGQYCFQNRTAGKVLYYINTSATAPTDQTNGLTVLPDQFSEVFTWVGGDYLWAFGAGPLQLVRVA